MMPKPSVFPIARPVAQLLRSSVCPQCRRSTSPYPLRTFASTRPLLSGHNRWSKIKHEKGAADKKKTAERGNFAKNLTLYSKLYGANPDLNAQLAKTIADAKKSGMPKANIDLAIARGQGKSSTGEKLETAMLEVMAPGSVAVIVDIECDNKQRALKDLKLVAKKHAAVVTPTTFLFTRLGRTTLKGPEGGGEEGFDDVLMQALEAGAEDIELDEDGNFMVWTQPNMTHQTAQSLSAALKTDIITSDIIWSPTADKVKLDDQEVATQLGDFLATVRDNDDVQAVYANAARGEIPEETWKTIEDNLD
ncbi:transcriptional regulator-domain-containing protein [Xylariales sp. AK1849]|nr:transcriptional regulator-domain-containing protein [Xylariales sp. AK1849]